MNSEISLPILTAILGAVAAGGIQGVYRYKDHEREKAAVRAALVMEVRAICDLIRFRHYLPFSQGALAEMRADSSKVHRITADLKEDYFSAFHSLLPKIGLLGAKDALLLVRFYMTCKGAKDSVLPDSVFAGNEDQALAIEATAQFVELLERALKFGDEITQWLPQPDAQTAGEGA